MKLCNALEKLQETLPPVFAGKSLDQFTGNGYRWRTLQNEKSKGETPDDIFLRSGTRKLLIVRDAFLQYWQTKLQAGEGRE